MASRKKAGCGSNTGRTIDTSGSVGSDSVISRRSRQNTAIVHRPHSFASENRELPGKYCDLTSELADFQVHEIKANEETEYRAVPSRSAPR